MNPPALSVLIPAAGASKRLGQAKQLVEYKGVSLLQNAINVAYSINPLEVIVVTGAHERAVKDSTQTQSVHWVHNPQWETGMGGSIALGARAANPQSGGLMILLVDQYRVDADDVQGLVRLWTVDRGRIVAAKAKDRLMPPVIFPPTCLESLQQLQGEKDVFELESKGKKIIIRGTTGVAMASGFNYYLKNYCNVHISWCGDQKKMPKDLPNIKSKIRIETPYQHRYNFNYCTFAYTMAFWDWKRWEQEIDWMALQGINMPLAITGHEVVIKKVYQKLGLTNEEINDYISGAPYLPFFMMGCLDGFGGPLPDVWFEEQEELQKKIPGK